MKLFIEIQRGSSFVIEVDNSDTLLKIKQKIEKSHHIPVSQQRIIFDGISIVPEYLNLQQCQILHESQIQINVSPNHSPIHKNDHMFHQTEEGLGSSMSAEEYFEMLDWPITTEELNKIYSYRPETKQQSPPSREEINKSHQDNLSVKLHQSSSSKSVRESVKNKILNMKKPVSVDSKNPVKSLRDMLKLPQEGFFLRHNGRVLNEDQSFEMNRIRQNDRIEVVESSEQIMKSHQDSVHQQPSSSKLVNRENIKDKLRFMITVFVVSNSGEKKPVTVARTGRVKVLKEVLNLPKEGFAFTHKGRVLNQNQSFRMNSIGHNDTIEIVALNS